MCVFLQITITFGHKKETLIKNHFTRRCMTHPVIFSLFVSFLKICVCEFRNHLRRTWDYFFSFFLFLKARFALSVSFCFFLMVTSVVLSTTPARCCSFSSFVLAWLLFTLFALMLIFGVASFVSFLLACLLLFFSLSLSLVFFFSLSSSACLPALALTGGYSSLGWAETASLYNTDRLLCNQIPSVATSERLTLSLPPPRAHTSSHAGTCTHTTSVLPTLEHCVCTCVCMCARMVYVQWPVYLQSFHLIHSWPAERKPLESLSLLPVFSTDPAEGSKVIVFRYPCLFCVSARPWLPYHTGDSGL